MDTYRKIHLIWILLIIAMGYTVNQPLREVVDGAGLNDLGLSKAGQVGFLFAGTFLASRLFHRNLLPLCKAFRFHVYLFLTIELSPLLLGSTIDLWRVGYLMLAIMLIKILYLPFWKKMDMIQNTQSAYL